MKTTRLFAYKFTQAEVDAGNADSLPSGSIVWVVDSNGVPTGKVYTASGGGVVEGGGGSSFREWQAKTAYSQGQIAVAPSTQGTISAGDLIVRATQGTSGATFSATEASKWTEVADDPDLVKVADVVNNLTSTDTGKPLSAAQGKALQDGKSATTHNHDTAYEAKDANIQTHISSTSNPHGVTKTQVGLDKVDNVSDVEKPLSDTQQRVITKSANPSSKAVAHPVNFTSATATDADGTYTASASGEFNASFAAWKAFDGTTSDWATNSIIVNYWIALQFPIKKIITRVKARGRVSNEFIATWRLEGSNDGTNWETIYSSSTTLGATLQTFDFTNNKAYSRYRIFALTSSGGAGNPGLDTLEFHEQEYVALAHTHAQADITNLSTDLASKEATANKVTALSSPTNTQYPSAKLVSDQLALKQNTLTVAQTDAINKIQATATLTIPTFTANTTAGTLGNYIALANSEYDANYAAWKALDGTTAQWATASVTANIWLRVKLPVAKVVTEIRVADRGGTEGMLAGWKFQGSNDGTSWTDLYTSATATGSTIATHSISNTTTYMYYRIFGPTTYGPNPGLSTFRLYENQYGFPTVTA